MIAAIAIAVLIVQPLSTFSIGVETGGPQLRALFAQPGLNLRFFLATFVVMPALAIALGVFAHLPAPLWEGLTLMSIAPPAPPSTRRLRKMGRVDLGLTWQDEAFVISIVTIPLTVAIVQSLGLVGKDIVLNWVPMIQRSILFFGAPMLAGLLVRRYLPALAAALVKPTGIAATIGLAVLAILASIVAIPVLVHYRIMSTAVVVAFVAVAVLVGHLLGGPGSATRVTLVAMLAARFPVPAMILAQSNGAIKAILPVILVHVIAGVVLVPIYARLTRSQTIA
ncbi:MAG TPA: hypothetical protein VEW74_03490 [Candidatus Nitrosotalea sp.]|nr:hypothetical protein [Candidatus Nitrosotalea sp.]